jgi:poly(A) polymerase
VRSDDICCSNGEVKYFGVTNPISTAGPTPQDYELTAQLEKVLRDFNLYEGPEEAQKREEVLGKLNVIVKEWVRQVSLKKVVIALTTSR